MTIFFASQNQGKIAEVAKIFAKSKHQLITLNDQNAWKKLGLSLDSSLEVAETGQTLADNALLKAQTWANLTHLPTLADDSGLLLNAFPGFPGVASNRWLEGSDDDRNRAILAKLAGQVDRGASFQTVLCLFDPQTKSSHFFKGEIKGSIAQEIQGSAGFGYDPIFIPEGYQKSFAQLGLSIKNKISHRARAMQALSQSDLFV